MSRYVEAKRLFLLCESLRFRPCRDARQGDRVMSLAVVRDDRAEHRNLTRCNLFLLERRFTQNLIECGEELRAMTTQRVECACLNERLEDSLIAHAKVDAVREIGERSERSARPCRDDRIDR